MARLVAETIQSNTFIFSLITKSLLTTKLAIKYFCITTGLRFQSYK